MRAVNLLPKDLGRSERRQPSAVVLTATLGAVLLTAIFAGWFLMASSTARERQNELDALHAELAAIPPPAPVPAGQATLAAEKSKRVGLLSAALAQRVAWDRILREISLVVPEDVWLETLNGNGPDPTAAPTPQGPPKGGFNLTGYAYSHDGVARLLARLNLIPHLEAVRLNSSIRDRTRGRSVVKFTIAATLRQGGPTS